MAIVEKRRLFRLKNEMRVAYQCLDESNIDDAINELSETETPNRYFPSIEEDQKPILVDVTTFGVALPVFEQLLADQVLSLSVAIEMFPVTLHAVGEVVYCKFVSREVGYRAGIKFKYMAKSDMQILEDYMVSRLQENIQERFVDLPLSEEDRFLFSEEHDKQ